MKKNNITEINIIDNQCPIPLESLAVLVTGEDNRNFKNLSKHISSEKVKVVLKHKETGEKVRLIVPIEFLELHHILYKNANTPSDIEIIGVLNNKVKKWEVITIIKDIWKTYDLVIVKCKESGKIIACKVLVKDINKTKLYMDHVVNKEQSCFNFNHINIWREIECQREIQVIQNLSQLMSSQVPEKV